MKHQLVYLFILCSIFNSCSGRKAYGEENPKLKINRFDVELYQYLTSETSTGIAPEHDGFMTVFGNQVINIGKPDSTGFYDRLKTFFSEPTLMKLYQDEQQHFADISSIENELIPAFEQLLKDFPNFKQPQIYMHVSGLNQNVIVTDEVLSLSADKYLGSDYSLYQEFYYDYQRQNMIPERIVPDYLLGYLIANAPFEGKQDVLLDRMLYEGKLRYIISRMLPGRQVWEYTAYSKDQYLWCSNNQSRIWKAILQDNHLYTPDYLITAQYMEDAPHTVLLPAESPGRVGVWVGYQIIISYMKNNPETTLPQLMKLTDAQELLKAAKYKP